MNHDTSDLQPFLKTRDGVGVMIFLRYRDPEFSSRKSRKDDGEIISNLTQGES